MADTNFTRTCTSCKTAFPATLAFFPKHKPGKYGLHSWCTSCKLEIDAARRNRPDQKIRQQKWRDENKGKVKKTNAEFREAGYKSTEHVRAWVLKNPDRAKELNREKVKRWRRTVPWYSLKARISTRINTMLKAGCGKKAERTTKQILGYTIEELMAHLASKFTDGMTWEKFMLGEIHLDHVIPVAFFKADSVESDGFKRCWALSNLQPLWAKDNLRKGSKLPFNHAS